MKLWSLWAGRGQSRSHLSEDLGGRLWLEPFVLSGTGMTHSGWQRPGELLGEWALPHFTTESQQLEDPIEYTLFGLWFFRSQKLKVLVLRGSKGMCPVLLGSLC